VSKLQALLFVVVFALSSLIIVQTIPSFGAATSYVLVEQNMVSSTPIQWVSVNNTWFGLGWAELAIIVLLCIIAVCLVILVVHKFRKHKTA
jgi:hypothetical protein